jgi:hypothetical protein
MLFKDTCLVSLEKIDRSPHIERLETPFTAAAPEGNHLIMSTQSINMQQTCIMNE